jgi:GAF domain-containing protein
VGLAAQSRRTVRVDDLESDERFRLAEPDFPHTSVLAVPLIVPRAEQLVGVLLVADKIGLPAFLPQDELSLSSLIDQSGLAVVIKQANLVREKREQGQELTILSQISQTLNDQLHLMDVDSVCRAILQLPNLKDTFQFDAAEICLWNAQTKTLATALRLVYGSPDIQSYARTYELSEGYTGWIAANQESLLIEDTHRFTQTMPRAGLSNFPYRSVLGVPLKIGRKLLGTLELVAAPIHAYESSDVTVLEIVANQAAVAIDHARLFQEAQDTLSKLTLLFDASHELSSTLSHEDLLRDLSSQMGGLCG